MNKNKQVASSNPETSESALDTLSLRVNRAANCILELINASEQLHRDASAVIDGTALIDNSTEDMLSPALNSVKELLQLASQSLTPDVVEIHDITALDYEFRWRGFEAPSAHKVAFKYVNRLYDLACSTRELSGATAEWEIESEMADAVFDDVAELHHLQKLRNAVRMERVKALDRIDIRTSSAPNDNTKPGKREFIKQRDHRLLELMKQNQIRFDEPAKLHDLAQSDPQIQEYREKGVNLSKDIVRNVLRKQRKKQRSRMR